MLSVTNKPFMFSVIMLSHYANCHYAESNYFRCCAAAYAALAITRIPNLDQHLRARLGANPKSESCIPSTFQGNLKHQLSVCKLPNTEFKSLHKTQHIAMQQNNTEHNI